jgi:hypothetical protein
MAQSFGQLIAGDQPTNKEWSCLDEKMMMYFQELRNLENNFDDLEYLHILRG